MLGIPEPPHKARAVVAVPYRGQAIILATDSDWVDLEIDAICNGAEDIGMIDGKDTDTPGVYLWEGALKSVNYSHEGYEPETVYTGTLRPITPAEWPALLAMSPPEPPIPVDLDDGRDTPILAGGQSVGP